MVFRLESLLGEGWGMLVGGGAGAADSLLTTRLFLESMGTLTTDLG